MIRCYCSELNLLFGADDGVAQSGKHPFCFGELFFGLADEFSVIVVATGIFRPHCGEFVFSIGHLLPCGEV